jgi:hypothetical protein
MDTNAQHVVNYPDSTNQELDLLTRSLEARNLESRKLREDEGEE